VHDLPDTPTLRHHRAAYSGFEQLLISLQGYHQARHPPSRASWWCQAYLWSHLRGDPWCSQDLRESSDPLPRVDPSLTVGPARERHPRLGHLHRARQAQDRHLARRRLRPQAPGPHPLRFRRISVVSRRVHFRASTPTSAREGSTTSSAWRGGGRSSFLIVYLFSRVVEPMRHLCPSAVVVVVVVVCPCVSVATAWTNPRRGVVYLETGMRVVLRPSVGEGLLTV
jgi:hypothetical protein